MICVVVPCYKVKDQILKTLKEIPSIVEKIIVVDDCCPENSGLFVQKNSNDPRIEILFHKKNMGVGGAVISGFKSAQASNSKIVIKLDGDGQMDPLFIPKLIAPILSGNADYTKGNRFFFIRALKSMPKMRLIGNIGLSFLNKIVTGYWNIMDPTNGYIAINTTCLNYLPIDKIANGYFFESDMLFRLSTINAVVKDIPMLPKYADEQSNLSILKTLLTFPHFYFINFLKRIIYNYYFRDFNLGTLFLTFGSPLFIFGLLFGVNNWYYYASNNLSTPTGTIMISVISVMLGFQSILFFLQYDISTIPKNVFSEDMKDE